MRRGDVQRPAGVAEIASQLTHDRRNRKRHERGLAFGVEAIDRAQQPDGGNLHQVLHRFMRVGVATRQSSGQGHVLLDDRVTRASISVLLPAAQRIAGGFRVTTRREQVMGRAQAGHQAPLVGTRIR